jgi:hypothetical protein
MAGRTTSGSASHHGRAPTAAQKTRRGGRNRRSTPRHELGPAGPAAAQSQAALAS